MCTVCRYISKIAYIATYFRKRTFVPLPEIIVVELHYASKVRNKSAYHDYST